MVNVFAAASNIFENAAVSLNVAPGAGKLVLCVGGAIAVVIVAVGVFFWLRRKNQA